MDILLIWAWSRRRSAASARTAWTGAAVGVVLVAMSVTVVTPRETVARVCRELGKAVDDGDMTAISARIAPDFHAEGFDREELLGRVTLALTHVRVDQVRLRNIDIDLLDDRNAIAAFDASCNVRTTEGFAGALPSRWRLSFRRNGETWLAAGIESIPVPPLHIARLNAWLR